MDVLGIVRDFLKGKVPNDLLETLEAPRDPTHGDAALPCFLIAKSKKQNPVAIATEFANTLKPEGTISNISAAGPYVNFKIDRAYLAKQAINSLSNPATVSHDKIKRYVIEFLSPNTNKPLHIGHVRNMLLGRACSKLLRRLGHTVFSVCLYNDRGIAICKSMLAYQKWGEGRAPDIKTDHFVGKFYVLYNEKVKTQPELEGEIQEMLRQWENGDPKVLALWKQMNAWAYDGFEKTFANFSIRFDKVYHESDIYAFGKEEVEHGLKAGIFHKTKDGAIEVNLEKHGLPNKILLRSDGTALYMTTDLVLAKKKIQDFDADQSVYVVANEQNLHFQQLFRILAMLGYSVEACHHLSYGMVSLPGGRIKSREGRTADADDLIDMIVEMARKEVANRSKLDDEELNHRAYLIGMAALKFFILKYDPSKDFVFNPEESLSFEGETGPYLQYTFARIRSIFRKSEVAVPTDADFSYLSSPGEHELVLALANFDAVIEESALKFRPSHLANYLISLAQLYNEFYHKYPVLKAEAGIREARLALSQAVAVALQEGLSLLGIATLEEM